MQTRITHNGTELLLSSDYEVITQLAAKGASTVRITKRVPTCSDIDASLAGLFSAHANSASIVVVVETVDDDGNSVEIHNETYTNVQYYQVVYGGFKTDFVKFVQ